MKNAIKYTAAMLLMSAGLNAYATKVTTRGGVKVDVNSNQQGKNADWSGANLNADSAYISLDVEGAKFKVTVTLDAAEWYGNSLLKDGKSIPSEDRIKNKNLARLLDEAFVTFSTAQGQISLGKQAIELMPNMEKSSLANTQRKHDQVLAVRFTGKSKAQLAGLGIDASFYETGTYDNKIADELGFNIIVSKQINNELSISLGLQSDESPLVGASRANTVTIRGLYQMSSKFHISAEYQQGKEDMTVFDASGTATGTAQAEESHFKIAGEYAILPTVVAGASYKSTDNNISAKDYTESKAYAVKQMSKDTDAEIYWSKKIINDAKDDAESTIGFRVKTKF